MKTPFIAIAVMAAAFVSAGPMPHHKTQAPALTQSNVPIPPCKPACALTAPELGAGPVA